MDVLVIGIFILGIEDAIGGVLFLDESGIFSAVTDCGDYSYGHFSCNSIRHFVAYQLGRDPHYALSKIARRQDKELQGEATLANAKRLIMESRRHGSSTKEEAREAWEGLPEYDLNDEYQWRRFYDLYDENVIGCDWQESVMEYDWDNMAYSFLKNCLPGLQELIKKELEQEALLKEQLVV